MFAAVQNSSPSASTCVTIGRESGLILCEWGSAHKKGRGRSLCLACQPSVWAIWETREGHGLLRSPMQNLPGNQHTSRGLTSLCFLQTQAVQHNKEMTLASNRSLAEGNLLYQPQLDAQKARLTQKYQELQVLFEAYQIKKTKLGNFFWVIFEIKAFEGRLSGGGESLYSQYWGGRGRGIS